MNNFYGCWVLLSENDNNKLTRILTELSKKYSNGDIFTPHISVNGSAQLPLTEAGKAATDAIEDIHKFEVQKESIKYSDEWSKTLYIQIKNNPNLTKISERLNKTFRKGKAPYTLDPHISLLYKEGLDNKVKENLALNLKVPDRYTVTSIAVATPGKTDDWRNYRNWKIVYRKDLV